MNISSKNVQIIWIISIGYFTHNVFFNMNYDELQERHCENCVVDMQVEHGY